MNEKEPENNEHHVDFAKSPDQLAGTILNQRKPLTPFLICFAGVIGFVPWLVNFDAGFSGVVLAMPSFNNAFGTECKTQPTPDGNGSLKSCELTAVQQSLLAIPYLFQGLGGALGGVSGAYIGRRGTITIGCLFTIIGASVMVGIQHHFVNFMVGKCIEGVGLGLLVSLGIVYGTECVPASRRGVLLSIYNVALAMGNAVVAAVCVGSSKLAPTNNLQWKTPIFCQIPIGVLLATLVWVFPESPRWLAVHSRIDEMRNSFARFYSSDPDSDEVNAQVADVQANLEHERETQATSSWLDIYRGTNLRRTVVSGFILVALAICGIQFILSYATVFLEDVGISNIFVVNVTLSSCILAGTTLTPFALEYLGCRGSLLAGFGVMSICMLIVAAVASGLGQNSTVAHTVLIVFLCIWAFTFGCGIGSAVWLSSTEMHSVRLRTYGQASSATVYQIFGFAATFWTPYMLQPQYGDWGTNVGYFYFGVNAISFTLTFFFVPETAKLTLEQIDAYFESGQPAWKTSIRQNKKLGMF